ncbi:MAG: PilN domain-containing protein [Chloroflexi bacterium]|nr:PilN domain-containing protein [Chloroflexota bacterium]
MQKTPLLDNIPITEDAPEPGLRESLALLGSVIRRWWRRKNPFRKRLVTLVLEEDALHLVAFRGDEVVKWSSLPLPAGLVKDGGVRDHKELGKLVRGFLAKNRVGSTKLAWAIGGFHSLSRTITLPVLPPSALREAILRETGRAMPIAMEDSHVSWQVLNRVDGHQKVFVLATPRNSLNSVIDALVAAKALGPSVELKPLALARLVNQEQAVIMDVQRQSVDVVIVVRWVPVVFRTLHPEEGSPISRVVEEVSRTIDFYNRNQTQERLHPEAPLFLTGPLAEGTPEAEQLIAALRRPLEPLQIALRCPQGFSSKKYAVNLGLAFGAPTWKISSKNRGLTLNVIPMAYRPHHSVAELAATLGAIPLGLAAVFLLYQMGVDASVAKDRAQSNWTKLQQDLVRSRVAAREAVKLDQSVKDIQARAQSLEKESRTVFWDMGTHTASMALVHKVLPEGASLESVSQTGRQITLDGKAASYDGILKYIVALEQSGVFSGVSLKNIGRPNPLGSEVNFSLDLSQK